MVIKEEYCVTVDAANAGKGRVTCRAIPRSKSATPPEMDVENNNNGTFSIYFTLKTADEYNFLIKFGGKTIPKGEYSLRVRGRKDGVCLPEQVVPVAADCFNLLEIFFESPTAAHQGQHDKVPATD